MKAITVDILKANGESYSNGGISARFDQALLVCEDGYIDVNDRTELPVVEIEQRYIGSRYAPCARVLRDPDLSLPGEMNPAPRAKVLGGMMGGCYIASSDSRYSAAAKQYGAVALHDRYETQEQYNALSI